MHLGNISEALKVNALEKHKINQLRCTLEMKVNLKEKRNLMKMTQIVRDAAEIQQRFQNKIRVTLYSG